MNEIIKAMEERRSIRKFKPDMPTKEDLEQIIRNQCKNRRLERRIRSILWSTGYFNCISR